MKKNWKLLLCAAIGIASFTACEDVPAPYNIPSEQAPVVTPAEPKGTGTLEDPFNAAAANAAAKKLAANAESETDYYIQGVVASIRESYSTTYGNASFYISDDGSASNQFYVFRALYLSNQKYSSGDNIEAGDTVIVCGKIVNYQGNTPETVQNKAYLYSLKKGNGVPQPPVEGLVGSGTQDDPYDVPSTIKLIAAGPPSTKIYTKGKVSKIDEIDTGNFGNATYYISNDGTTTDQLEVYRGLGLGGAKFTSTDDLKVGDEVIVYGVVVYYNGKTMEFTQGSQLYMLNGKTASTPDPTPSGDAKGTGVKEDPFNVAAAMASEGTKWVKAYIVGWIDGKTLSEGAKFNGNATVATNLLIADSPDETNVANCMPVQLPSGEVRTALNLLDNPNNYKKEVSLYGSIEKYFGATGLKNVSEYVLDGNTPDPTPTGEAKGSGTLADPFNAMAAYNTAKALGADEISATSYYIKGKISSIKYTFNAQYGTATFNISDDGTSKNELPIYSTLYLGNRKWVEGDTQVKVGDDVIIYGQLTNYKGNTPETASQKSYIYSLNGKTEGGEAPVDPDPQPSNVKTLADFANGDFEAWEGDTPTGWQTASSAGNASLSKSTDAHGGSFAVCVKGESQNKRLGYQEMSLEAGTYTCSFWTKAATSKAASLCPGYAAINDSSIAYNYDKGDDGKNKYVNDISQTWQQVTYSFTLDAKTTVCLIVMNSKTTGSDLLIDDFTITKK